MAVALPLFPLHAVLFPGGEMRLRIFERRYLDLVRECSLGEGSFGVCLILAGSEAEGPALPAAWGTSAGIVDFYTLPDGLLGITARGHSRFHVVRTRVRDNGIILGEVEFEPGPAPQPLRAEHCLLATLLERIAEKVGGELRLAPKACYDDAAWVGYRLAELLPLANRQRQELLQMRAPDARLDRLAELLPQLQREGSSEGA
ncbi:MAG TPA: LON peptidase substrate-binding domain-containing protein [Xanthomonadaceae bacterium]|nr:LON peptidase substrate-binding domain-containing protein [Xanthomonadaceae bacterium]